MWVMSQSKNVITNVNHFSIDYEGTNKTGYYQINGSTLADDIATEMVSFAQHSYTILGEYGTKREAQIVMRWIFKALSNGVTVFEMPQAAKTEKV